MAAEDLLRLAWQADRDGRAGMRDALLTLAVAESGTNDAVSAERCRKQLVARRPDHWLAAFPTVGQALRHPRVAAVLDRLRTIYPPVRVQRLLLRGDAQRGPYSGHLRPLSRLLDEIFEPTTPAETPGTDDLPSLPFPGASSTLPPLPDGLDGPQALFTFYLSVLLAMAILLASVLPPASKDKAA